MTAGGRDPRTWQLTLYACPAEKKLHSRTIFARIGGTGTNNGNLYNKIALNVLKFKNIKILKLIFYKRGANFLWLQNFLQILSCLVPLFSGTKSASNHATTKF